VAGPSLLAGILIALALPPWGFWVLAFPGAGLLWWRSSVGRELGLMTATKTSSAADVSGKQAGRLVELKGSLRSDALIKGEFSQRECV